MFRFFTAHTSLQGGAEWPHGWCARLRIEQSGFEPWPGTLCCVLGQYASPANLRCTGEFNAGDAMDWHPIQGGLEILLVASCHRSRR